MKGLLQSNLFDLEEIDNINIQIKAAKHKTEVMKARREMSLELPYYANPKNDNELLFNYQYDYIVNNNEKAWKDLMTLSYKVIQRIIWGLIGQKKVVLDEEEQMEKASIAIEYVLRRYDKNVGYRVNNNFILFLKDGVKHAIKYKTKLEQNTDSLEAHFID